MIAQMADDIAAGRDPADLLAPLTPRQREVAFLAAEGFTNQEIADRLYVEPRSVNKRLWEAAERLGITGGHRRVRLARVVWQASRG